MPPTNQTPDKKPGYPRAELLAEPGWLLAHSEDEGIRIIDCSAPEAYKRAHIPGAAALGIHSWLKDPKDPLHVMAPSAFAEAMGRLGVSDGTTVVAYDDAGGLLAARLWWVLRHYGHPSAKVLNGGWNRWLAEGRPISVEEARPQPATFTPRPDGSAMCTLDGLGASVTKGSVQVLDARSPDEWAGTNSHGNKRAGHLPRAANFEWSRALTQDSRRILRPAAELQDELARAGLDRDRPTVTHCQAGVRAAHTAFVLTLLGWNDVQVYDGSMAEWANRDDTPLETALPVVA